MLALCQHNTLACYAFYYAGIFDTGLSKPIQTYYSMIGTHSKGLEQAKPSAFYLCILLMLMCNYRKSKTPRLTPFSFKQVYQRKYGILQLR